MTEFYAAERWLPIAGFEGLYEVSDFGRVRSLDRMVKSRNHPRQQQRLLRGRLLHQTTNKPTESYYIRKQVKLCKGNNSSTFNVARLVAQAFIPNPFRHPLFFTWMMMRPITKQAIWSGARIKKTVSKQLHETA